MSFKTRHMYPGILQPEEFKVVEAVFKRIVLQSWFTRSPHDQQQFAAYVINSYFRGLTDTDRLYHFCLAAAKARHGHAETLAAQLPLHRRTEEMLRKLTD